MNYNYEEFINDLNNGKIESILFSIQNYSHYKNCSIKRCIDITYNKKQLISIKVKLVKDDSETVSFYKKFNENYKLFKFGRKGSFTLKQLWDKIVILDIKYTNQEN